MHACNHNTWEAEAGGSLSKAQQDCLKKNKRSVGIMAHRIKGLTAKSHELSSRLPESIWWGDGSIGTVLALQG